MKSVLDFLSQLNQHNNREWFQQNKAWYEEVKTELERYVDREIIAPLARNDSHLANINAKKCLFRIYRDVRFSKNKLPYKTAMGFFIGRDGRKSPAGYYLHIEPSNSFVGGGAYRPEAAILKAIRNEIYFDAGAFKKIVSQPDFVHLFGELRGERLKRAPKGFPADFQDVEWLKLKDFTVLHAFSDQAVCSEDFGRQAVHVFHQMKPLNDFIYRAISNME